MKEGGPQGEMWAANTVQSALVTVAVDWRLRAGAAPTAGTDGCALEGGVTKYLSSERVLDRPNESRAGNVHWKSIGAPSSILARPSKFVRCVHADGASREVGGRFERSEVRLGLDRQHRT